VTAVLRCSSILRAWHRYFQKQEANWRPQSETIVSGSLCRQKMLDRNSLVRPSASMVVIQGAKCYSLVRRSMTTQMESKPFRFSRPVTKSIEILCQGCSAIGRGHRTVEGA
jgi:hypothetical protein